MITIGVDPHKSSHTAYAIDGTETVLGQVRVAANRSQVERLVAWAAPFPERQWGVEGANGVGLLLAQQLVAAGERVVDVPATLAARVRTLGAGHTDKTDAHDAAAVAVVALRHRGLRVVTPEDHSAVLHLLSERRAQLVAARTQALCRLHAQLRSLVPGGAKRSLSASQAALVLRGIRPVSAIDIERKALARELLADIRSLETRIKTLDTRIAAAVRASASTLTEIPGVGPVLAAKIIGIVGDPDTVRDPGPVRRLRGRVTDRSVQRRARPSPSEPAREPPTELRDPHGRGHPTRPRRTRPRLLRTQTRRRQEPRRSAPLPQTTHREHHLPPPPRRRSARRRESGPGGHRGTTSTSAAGSHPHTDSSGKSPPDHTPTLRPPLDREAFGCA